MLQLLLEQKCLSSDVTNSPVFLKQVSFAALVTGIQV